MAPLGPKGEPFGSSRRKAMELFSYHLIQIPVYAVAARILGSSALREVPGLRHFECLLPMRMGHPVSMPGRYHWGKLAFFGFWQSEAHLERFLEAPPYSLFERPSWHVRLRFYRRWGTYRGLDEATAYTDLGRRLLHQDFEVGHAHRRVIPGCGAPAFTSGSPTRR